MAHGGEIPADEDTGTLSRWWTSGEPEPARMSFDQLDQLDRGIIRLLRHDGRKSNAQMARELKSSQPTIRNRIARMTEGGVIKVAAILNPQAHGYECDVLLGIRCKPGSAEEIAESVSRRHYVLYVGYVSGGYDLLVDVLFHSDRELYDFLQRELYTHPGIVSVDVMHVIKAGRVDFDWTLSVSGKDDCQPIRDDPGSTIAAGE